MNAPHYTDPTKHPVRNAQRRKLVWRIALGTLAIGFVAGVVAVESPNQGGLFSRLGLLNDDAEQSLQSPYSRGQRDNLFTTGFYEFNDGPEEDVRKGRQSRQHMAYTTSPHFAAEYFEDPDLSASRGFFGFWASFELDSGGEETAQQRGGGMMAKLAREATPTIQKINRLRTRKARDSEESTEKTSLFSRLFNSKDQTEAAPVNEPKPSPVPAVAEKRSGVTKFLNRMFSAKEVQEGDDI